MDAGDEPSDAHALKIFISYRRDDVPDAAGRLHDHLSESLRGRIFMDVDNIPPGVDFVRVIDKEVGECDVLIAVIGKKWLKDSTRRRRLDNPEDYVRLEIEAALRRPDVRVIPLLLHGARMPTSTELPEELKPFARRNYVTVSHANWSADVGSLVHSLRDLQKRKEADGPAQAAAPTVDAEQEARLDAEQQAQRQAEQEARRQAEEQARRDARQQARRQAEQQARLDAEQLARRQAAEDLARRQAEARARLEAEERARRERHPAGWFDRNKAGALVLLSIAAVVVLAAASFALLRAGGGGDDSHPVVTKTVRVAGDQPWTDTGIDLLDGDSLKITASGTVLHDGSNPDTAVDPDGLADGGDPALNTVGEGVYVYPPGHGGLVARIGGQAEVFGVGTEWHENVAGDGRLELGINDYNYGDVDAAAANNSGAFDVDIEVTRPA